MDPGNPGGAALRLAGLQRHDRVWLWRDGYLKVDALDLGDAKDLATTQTIETKRGLFAAEGLTVAKSRASRSSTKTIACGLPMLTHVTSQSLPPTLIGARTTRPSAAAATSSATTSARRAASRRTRAA